MKPTPTPSMKPKQKKVKARKAEQLPDGLGVPHHFYYVLPADAASYEKMVEQMAQELYEGSPAIAVSHWDVAGKPRKDNWRRIARRALAAIGIKEPKK